MSNRTLLQSIQRSQRDKRMEALNPDKVAEVLRIKESYVKYENLRTFESAITKLLADMETEIERIKSHANEVVKDAKSDIKSEVDGVITDLETRLAKKVESIESMDNVTLGSIQSIVKRLSDNLNSLKGQSKQQITKTKEDISSDVDSMRKEFESRIKSLETDLFNSIDDIETLKKQPSASLPNGLMERINSYIVQRSVSIPVTTDQGGLGTSVRPSVGQVPVGNLDGTYSPGSISGAAHIIQDEGISLTQRANLDFVGSGVVVTDGGAGPDSTIVTITSGSGITRSITVTSGNVSPAGSTASTDYVYLVAGAHTITLPTAVGNTNRYTVKNNHSANITVDTTSSQTIDGTTSISISPEEAVDIISTNTNWSII